MILDLIEVKPRINVKKVIIISLILIVIITLFTIIVISNHAKNKNRLDKVQDNILARTKITHQIKIEEEIKNDNIVEKVKGIYHSDTKRAFLTFDDGPSKTVTIPILDYLKEQKIKATFFVLGSNVERYPEIVKRAYEEGHYIANHSFTHEYSSVYASPESVIDEYNRTEKAIDDAIGNQNYSSRLFRFPGGTSGGKYAEIKAEAANIFTQHNVAHLDWNALTADAAGLTDVNQMLQYVEQTIGNKNSVVILMHDTGAKKGTYELLPLLVQALREKGYAFENIYDILK